MSGPLFSHILFKIIYKYFSLVILLVYRHWANIAKQSPE